MLVVLLKELESLTIELTLTSTAANVASPLSDTKCQLTVLMVGLLELLRDILTTRRTDLEEQIGSVGKSRLKSLHTIPGTSLDGSV
jgi:hypothetical protein